MDTTDFTNQQADEQEQLEFEDSRIETEQDHDFDTVKRARKDVDQEVEKNLDDSARYEQETGVNDEEDDYVEMDAHDEAEMFNEATGFDGIRGYEPTPQNYE